MGILEDKRFGLGLMGNPQLFNLYAKQIEDQRKLDQERQLAKQYAGDATSALGYAPVSQQFNTPSGQNKYGTINLDIEGKGLINKTQDPTERRYLEFQRDLVRNGNPLAVNQMNTLSQNMQNSAMTNTGAMNREKYAQKSAMEREIYKQKMDNGNLGFSPKEILSQANTLRDDYNSSIKEFKVQASGFDIVRNATKNGIGDTALVTAYLKILDPQSVVRGEEFDSIVDSSGLSGQMKAKLKNVLRGDKLDDNLRRQILEQAGIMYNDAYKQYDNDRKFYSGIATQNKIPVSYVMPGNIYSPYMPNKTPVQATSPGTTPINFTPFVGKPEGR